VSEAYVLIETTIGRTQEVVDALRSLPGIQDVDPITGPYDIIARVFGPDHIAIGSLVATELATINGIARTLTCLSVGNV